MILFVGGIVVPSSGISLGHHEVSASCSASALRRRW
jgi:hypothetical protein